MALPGDTAGSHGPNPSASTHSTGGMHLCGARRARFL
jgi:hypothetical protein